MTTNKIFVIGFQKTGTTSLENALQYLGYRVYGGDKNLQKFNNSKDLKKYIEETLKVWDSVQDMPWPMYYKELYEIYPKAKFILTLRDSRKWIESVVKYFGSIRTSMTQIIYKVPCAEGHEEVYLQVYNKHNKEVIEYFKDNPNFLIMEQGINFDYETLCEFLNINEIPKIEFPHSRQNKAYLSRYRIYRYIRSFYWNFKKKY